MSQRSIQEYTKPMARQWCTSRSAKKPWGNSETRLIKHSIEIYRNDLLDSHRRHQPIHRWQDPFLKCQATVQRVSVQLLSFWWIRKGGKVQKRRQGLGMIHAILSLHLPLRLEDRSGGKNGGKGMIAPNIFTSLLLSLDIILWVRPPDLPTCNNELLPELPEWMVG